MAVDLGAYENRRNSINQDYAAKSSTNAYARFLAQQRGDRSKADYSRDFGRRLPRFTASWGRRGLTGGGVRSGTYRQGATEYLGDYNRNLAQIAQDQAQTDYSYQLTDQQQAALMQRELSQLEYEKSQEIAMTAANLAALQPYLQ
jgi:hypothetical protein